jgi:hypothetical protein
VNPDQIAQFYAARDARTMTYGGDERALRTEVIMLAGEVVTTRPGQVALLALTNMMARTHRHLTVNLTPAKLVAESMISASSIEEAVAQSVLAINPAAKLRINGRRIDNNEIVEEPDGRVSIMLGTQCLGDQYDICLGWSGGRAHLATRPVGTGFRDSDVLGAATAACLGAGALFELSRGRRVWPTVINLAERACNDIYDLAAAVPPSMARGVSTATVVGPIDAGDVAIVGAGAVAHALGWWAREFGHVGAWSVIDGDHADLSNTNRCLGMSSSDAGWPGGLPGAPSRAKADILADVVAGQSIPTWFNQWAAKDPSRCDLVLVLANEHGVRAHTAALGEPILLQATTSPSWTAELHRHVPGVDDCPACRIPDQTVSGFACSSGPAGPDPDSGDAALPFLSAAAGLMLMVALQQLSPEDLFITGRHNHWRLCFERGVQLRRSVHGHACPHTLPTAARRIIQSGQPRRHDRLENRR